MSSLSIFPLSSITPSSRKLQFPFPLLLEEKISKLIIKSMAYNFLKKSEFKVLSTLILKVAAGVLFLTPCFFVSAEESLISVVHSNNGNVTYINMSPLRYEAKKEGFSLIQVTPENSAEIREPGELRPMELIMYSTCNRGDPQREAAIGFRAQVLLVSFLMSPHPDDLLAAYYLLPLGWFRMIKEGIRGHPYFYEKGVIRIEGVHNKLWEVTIQRSDVTATNAKTDYSIGISKEADQPLFIQALKSAAKPAENNVPQVTLILESPSLYVRATYNLIHKGSREYQLFKKVNILKWWGKQQKWCPIK